MPNSSQALVLILMVASVIAAPGSKDPTHRGNSRPRKGFCIDRNTNTPYKVGDTWKSPTAECETCTCKLPSRVRCAPVDCPAVECERDTIIPEGQCCPVCPVCGDMPVGRATLPGNLCEGTDCQPDGIVLGWAMACAITNICENGAQWTGVPGQCCPQCPTCKADDGTWHFPGRVVFADPCRLCSCDGTTAVITCVDACKPRKGRNSAADNS